MIVPSMTSRVVVLVLGFSLIFFGSVIGVYALTPASIRPDLIGKVGAQLPTFLVGLTALVGAVQTMIAKRRTDEVHTQVTAATDTLAIQVAAATDTIATVQDQVAEVDHKVNGRMSQLIDRNVRADETDARTEQQRREA